jgi:hypothetical protein
MIRNAKGIELIKIIFITNLTTLGSNMFFTLKKCELKKCGLNKSYSYLCDKGHECIIYMI